MSGGARQVNGTRDGGYRQRTLKNPIGCSGTGLHSGAKVALTFHPSAPNSGIVFRRVDISGAGSEIAALWNNVVDTTLNTTLGNGSGVRIGTVEHVMAALYGCGIDNAVIEVHGPEVPIMDGSAAPFVFLIECAGVIEQNAPRRVVEILKPIAVGGHQRTAVLVPGRGSTVSFEIDFASSLVARQNYFVDLSMGTFAAEISRARTFGFDHEVAELRAAGLARGGSLENAVVISGDRVLNEDGLRYEDEFVRHKVLDSIGDLYLAGAAVLGHFHGYRSGHALNNELLRAVFADRNAWRYTVLGQDSTTDTDANTAWRDEAQAIPA